MDSRLQTNCSVLMRRMASWLGVPRRRPHLLRRRPGPEQGQGRRRQSNPPLARLRAAVQVVDVAGAAGAAVVGALATARSSTQAQ